jgi:hypothetical protein
MSQPHILALDLWTRHEARVLDVLVEALTLLQREPNLEESEVDLNRRLYRCLQNANRNLYLLGRSFDIVPTLDGKNPPYADDQQRATRENKVPDFYWGFTDHTAPVEKSYRHFVVECKRLGKRVSSQWVFNTNYVQHGILRFITEEHGYAMGEESAAMVGYIQNMDVNDIFVEVNSAAQAASIPALFLHDETWNEGGITRLEHTLERRIPVFRFALHHLWVDLRNCYTSP